MSVFVLFPGHKEQYCSNSKLIHILFYKSSQLTHTYSTNLREMGLRRQEEQSPWGIFFAEQENDETILKTEYLTMKISTN
jgi:hypothetical protein